MSRIQRLDNWTAVAVAGALAVVAIVVLVVVVAGGGDDGGGAPTGGPGEIFLEPAGEVGPAVFTKTVERAPAPKSGGAAPTAASTVPSTVPPTTVAPTTTAGGAGGAVVVSTSGGGTPGLYGGTQDNGSCDPAQLVAFLEDPANAGQARAWAAVLGIDVSQIRDSVSHLTPVVLTRDTRVTNHGYDGGRATPRQAVFQAGTAVLVDDRGTPRVRCKCGNPLLEPVAVSTAPSYTGTRWATFNPVAVVVVTPAPAPLSTLVLVDVDTGAPFERPVGTAGEADAVATTPTTPTTAATTALPATTTAAPKPTAAAPTVAPATTRPVTTLAPTTTSALPSTTAVAAPVDVTREGTVAASSEFPDGNSPAALAFDGDPTTSWFSAGDADGPTSTLTWSHSADDVISEVYVVGNAANANPQFRRNFGFRSLTVRVLDASGAVVFSEDRALPGTPDPDVIVNPNVRGRRVEIVFTGHEAPDCGGIAELVVTALR